MVQGTETGENVKTPQNRSLDILIVDDEKDVLDVLKEMIELIGHRVTATVSPKEAVEIAGREKFDIIITDISMPGLTGWDLLAKIKEMGVSAPVLLISGRAESIPGERIAAEGGAGILPKPFRLDDLRSAIRGIIEKEGPG